MKRKRILIFALCLLGLFFALFVIDTVTMLAIQQQQRAQASAKIDQAAATIRLGIRSDRVALEMESSPDESGQMTGVLVNASLMLAAENAKAAKHGVPKTYNFDKWTRGGNSLVVVYGEKGEVVGRWAVRQELIGE